MTETGAAVSIVIVNYNTPELVTSLIRSITEQTSGIEYEIIVVDNASDTGRRFKGGNEPLVRFLQSETNLGFARAANLAARQGKAPFLLFANSDCKLTSNIIPAMTKFMQENPDCAACSPKLVDERGDAHSSLRRFPDHRNILFSRGSILGLRGKYTIPVDDSRKPVESMAATFMMVRRDSYEQVRGFDEQFFMYVEDTDLCKKFADSGKRVFFLGDLSVMHLWGASTRLHPWRMKWEHHKSMLRYFRKHYPERRIANFFLTIQLLVNYLLVSLKLLFNRQTR